MIKLIYTQKGFTLVETLVAISILLVAIVGPMTAASRGMQSAFAANDRITAVYLAQETIEQFMALRDENALASFDASQSGGTTVDTWEWFSNLPSDCTNTNGCDYDIVTGSFRECSDLNGCTLYLDESATDFYYSYDTSSGEPSNFTRKLRVTDVVSDQEVSAAVTVTWLSAATKQTESLTLQMAVFDQYDYLQ